MSVYVLCIHTYVYPNVIVFFFIVQLPKYVRVNVLKTTLTSVITRLEHDGYVHHDCYCEGLEKYFSVDPIIPDVLAFHSSVTLTDHPLYCDSHIILQDKVKSTCIYVHTLYMEFSLV